MSKKTIMRRPAKKSATGKLAQEQLTKIDGQEQSWQQLYILCQHWQSDIAFFADEIRFLQKLIDTHFTSLVDEKNLDNTRKLTAELQRLEKRRVTISQKVTDHVSRLGNLVENPFVHDAKSIKAMHAEAEGVIAGFVKGFRVIKKKIFALAEEIDRAEKGKRRLTGR